LIALTLYNFGFEYHVQILFAAVVLVPQLIALVALIILEWIAGLHSSFMFSSNYLSGIATSLSQTSIGNKKLADKIITVPQKKDKDQKEKENLIPKGEIHIEVRK